jgi:hypothetical protein
MISRSTKCGARRTGAKGVTDGVFSCGQCGRWAQGWLVCLCVWVRRCVYVWGGAAALCLFSPRTCLHAMRRVRPNMHRAAPRTPSYMCHASACRVCVSGWVFVCLCLNCERHRLWMGRCVSSHGCHLAE